MHKKFLPAAIALIFIALVATISTSTAQQAAPITSTSAYPTGAGTIGSPDLPLGSVELVSARTIESKTWQLPSGQLQTLISSGPLHYRAADGSLQDIDPTFVAFAGGFLNEKNSFVSRVASDGTHTMTGVNGAVSLKPAALNFRDADNTILQSTAASPASLSLSAGTILAPNLFPNGFGKISLERALARDDLVMTTSPSAPQGTAWISYDSLLTIPSDAFIVANGASQPGDFVTDGGIQIVASNGATITIIYAPVAHDSRPGGSVDDAVVVPGQLRLMHGADGIHVEAAFPASWFSDSRVVYPVTLDPDTGWLFFEDQSTIVMNSVVGNGVIHYADTTFQVGDQKITNGAQTGRMVTRAPLSSIDDRIISLDGFWTIQNQASISGSPGSFDVYQLMGDTWSGPTITWANSPGIGSSLFGSFAQGTAPQAPFNPAGTAAVESHLLANWAPKYTGSGHTDKISFDTKMHSDMLVATNYEQFQKGNLAPAWWARYTIDSTPPTTTKTVIGGTFNSAMGWYYTSNGPNVQITCSDTQTGCTKTEWSIDNSHWLLTDGSPMVTATGTTSWYSRGTDGVLNVETPGSPLVVRWDASPPTTTASPPTLPASGWYRASVTVTLTASEGSPSESGVAGTFYAIDGGAQKNVAANGQPVINGDGTHTLVYFSTDIAGNSEPPHSLTIKIDTTPPTVSASRACTGTFVGNWCKGTPGTGTGSASDSTSQLASGSPSCTYGSTVVACSGYTQGVDTQIQTYRITANDIAGNSATTTTQFGVDSVKPSTGIGLDGSQIGPNAAGWYRNKLNAVLIPFDATSGVQSTSYVANGATGTWTGTRIPLNLEGTNTISATSTDNAGWAEDSHSSSYSVDSIAPVTTVTASGNQHNPTWYVSPVTMTYAVAETGSGVKSTSYSLDGQAAVAFPSLGYSIQNDGRHTFVGFSQDNADNVETGTSKPIWIDQAKPTTTISRPTVPASGWYTQNPMITLTGSDATSGVQATYYTINGGAPQNYSSPFTAPNQGTVSFQYWSLDFAGNIEDPHSDTWKTDSVAPATSASFTCAGNPATWCRTSASMTLTVVEATSPSTTTYYRVNGGATQTYTTSVNISDEGYDTIEYWSTDFAGNTEQSHAIPLRIDLHLPVSTLSFPASGPNSWYTSSISVTMTSTDFLPGSNVSAQSYNLNNGTNVVSATTTTSIPVSAEGTTQINYFATDNAGNNEIPKVAFVAIDKTPPVTTVAAVPATPNGNNGWYVVGTGLTAVTFTASCADSGSSCALIEYNLDGLGWATYNASNSPQRSQDGNHTFQARSTDRAGLVSAVQSITVHIDSTQPVVSATASCTLGQANWCVSTATLGASAVDSMSGPGPITMQNTTGAGWFSYSASAKPTYPLNGYYAILVNGSDAAGNQALTTAAFKVDVDGPRSSITRTSAAPTLSGWYVTPVALTLNGFDDAASVESNATNLQYRLNNGTWTNASLGAAIVLSTNGTTRVDLQTIDTAGNWGAIATATYLIDMNAPTSSLNYSPSMPASTWWNGCVVVTPTGTDATSGWSFDTWRLNGGAWSTNTSFTVCNNGVHTVNYNATDIAGNYGATNTATVRVDTIPPTCGYMLVSGTPGDNNWYKSPVTLTLNGSDANSGLQYVNYTIMRGGSTYSSGSTTTVPLNVSMPEGQDVAMCTAKDVAGNTGSGADFPVKVDFTPPSLTMQIQPLPEGSGWIHGCATPVFSLSDAVSGPGPIFWSLDGSAYANVSAPTICNAGPHTMSAFGKDNAGNPSATVTATFNVDNDPPTCSVALVGGTLGSTPWYVTRPQYQITASDPAGGSGLKDLEYMVSVNGVAQYPQFQNTTVNGTTIDVNADGTIVVNCLAHDNANWSSGIASRTAQVDTTLPSTSASTDVQPSGAWYTRCPYVTLTATDITSGVATTGYRVDGVGPSSYAAPFQVCGEGKHSVDYWSTDNASNVEPTKTYSVWIDTQPPATAAAQPSGTIGNHSWYKSNVSVTLTCNDGTPASVSGCFVTTYRVDGAGLANGTQGSNTTIVPIGGDGVHTLSYWSTDVAGNQELQHTTPAIKIDTTFPKTTIALQPTTPNGLNGWYNTTMSVQITATDATSGIDRIEYVVDHGPTQVVAGPAMPLAFSSPGTHTVSAHAIDNASNTETWSADVVFKLDQTPPTTSNSTAGLSDGDWYHKPTTVTLSCVDGMSGCNNTWYRISNGTWTQYNSSINLNDGYNWIEYYSTDIAGNKEATTPDLVRVDTVPPNTTWTPDGAHYYNTTTNEMWVAKSSNINLFATDAVSHVAYIDYWIDGVPQNRVMGAAVTIPMGQSTHEYTINYSAVDYASNVELQVGFTDKQTNLAHSKGFKVMVDASGPSTTLNRPQANAVYVDDVIVELSGPTPYVQAGSSTKLEPAGVKGVTLPTETAVISRRITVNISVSDPVGVDRIDYFLDGNPDNYQNLIPRHTGNSALGWDWPWQTDQDAANGNLDHVLWAVSYDNFGNPTFVFRNVTLLPSPAAAQTGASSRTNINTPLTTLVDGMVSCTPSGWQSTQSTQAPIITSCIDQVIQQINSTPTASSSTSSTSSSSQQQAAPSTTSTRSTGMKNDSDWRHFE